ncbi:MAG: hypothetical protein JSW07_18560 [bacterium]|nr:MAG: hypothetical protein JSW07_18560 [bacterium]
MVNHNGFKRKVNPIFTTNRPVFLLRGREGQAILIRDEKIEFFFGNIASQTCYPDECGIGRLIGLRKRLGLPFHSHCSIGSSRKKCSTHIWMVRE